MVVKLYSKEISEGLNRTVLLLFRIHNSNLGGIEKTTAVTREKMRQLLIEACQEFHSGEVIQSPLDDIPSETFLDFNEDNFKTSNDIVSDNKIEQEVLKYLDDSRKHITTLKEYPLMKQFFLI